VLTFGRVRDVWTARLLILAQSARQLTQLAERFLQTTERFDIVFEARAFLGRRVGA